MALFMAILFIPLFSWADYLFYPEHFKTFLGYRVAATALVLVLFFLNQKAASVTAVRNIAVSGFYIIGIFLILMIMDVNGFDTPYYAGLLLLFIVFLSFVPLETRTLAVHTILLYMLYVASAFYSGNGHLPRLFFVNNIFLVSSLCALLVASYFNYRKRLQEFDARKKLKEAEEKLLEYTRKLENSVEESESKYATVVNNAREGIVVVRKGRIVFWNPESERVLSCRSGSLQGRDFKSFFPGVKSRVFECAYPGPDDAEDACVLDTLEIKCSDDEKKWLEVMAVPVTWQGEAAGLFFIRDVTAKRTLEHELIQAQKMEAIGTLASGVAHDLNNIFQIIAGYVQMGIEVSQKDGTRLKYFLGQIEKTVERASLVTRQLLVFSRKEESKREVVDVNKQIVSLSRLLQRVIPKMIRIDLRLSANAGSIMADPIQLEQVLMNLSLNARDAMPEGGELVISTNRIKGHWDSAPVIGSVPLAKGQNDFVRIQIRDTGTGMTSEVRERIFDPFFTTKEEGRGTGLGLAIVYGIVKEHGGWITCESEPGKGTTFSIFFPGCLEDEEDAKKAGESISPHMEFSEVILLVDDEEQIRDIGKNMLEKAGFQVITASSGEEALEIFRRRAEEIKLVLLDLNMPGMGGFRCLKQLKELAPDIRVIICTGYLDEETTLKIREFQVEDFVHKPFRFSEILPIIRARLSG